MTSDEVFHEIQRFFTERFELSDGEVTKETTFADAGLDSIDLMSAALVIEDDFGVEIVEEDLEGVFTFGDAASMIAQKLAVTA